MPNSAIYPGSIIINGVGEIILFINKKTIFYENRIWKSESDMGYDCCNSDLAVIHANK